MNSANATYDTQSRLCPAGEIPSAAEGAPKDSEDDWHNHSAAGSSHETTHLSHVVIPTRRKRARALISA